MKTLLSTLLKLALLLSLFLSGVEVQAASKPLRAGDIVFIALPGEETLNKEFQINKAGLLLLPEVGELEIANLTPEHARKKVRKALSRVYLDMGRFDLSVRERRLLVTVLGFVKQPGAVDLPADGNVQMALNKAGGLIPGAQLDRIQVRRGKQILPFDYKKYLDTGNVEKLPTLQPLDIVFVPASPLIGNVQVEFDAATLVAGGDAGEDGNSIRIFGEVNNPGSFSYKTGATVVDLLMRAGGVTRFAGVEQIRIISEGSPQAFNLKQYLDTGKSSLMPRLVSGATIFVPKEVEEIKSGERTVYVMGEVFKPGAFEGSKEASFMDILANAGGPTRYAESRLIRILRPNGEVIPFDLTAYAQGGSKSKPPIIYPGDAIFVPEKSDINEKSWLSVSPNRAVGLMGAVYKPGRYEWSDEMSILDLLSEAGGPTAKADIAHLQILSKDSSGKTVTSKLFDLDGFINKGGDMKQLPTIRPGTTVVVPELPQDPTDNKAQWVRQPAQQSIYIFGSVGSPGRYMFNNSLGFLDILSAADGPNSDADIHNIKVTHRNGHKARTSHLNLAHYFETGDETLLPEVLPGDTIYIPSQSGNWLDRPNKRSVRVIGAIGKPGRYEFNDEMTLLDLLAEAGGPTNSAYLEKIVVVNRSCCGEQSKTFDLVGFAKNPDFDQIPTLRAGDTVYIPDVSQSGWQIFMTGVRDTASMLSVFGLLSVLGGSK
jgi:protein involved in polysaccharide export with SLBB domain